MRVRFVPSAVATAALALMAGSAMAQSSVSIYGNLDVGVDHFQKTEGNVQGTLFGSVGGVPVPNSVAAPERSITRVATSASAQSLFGFRGTEDLGGGYNARFVLEGTLVPDSGTLGNDGRIFGRAAWVGIGTPYGEIHVGRQASPMLIAYSLATTERLGTTDVMAGGLVVNNLQSYHDNSLAYFAKTGPWFAVFSASPNAGVASKISAARAPAANDATGQVLGGASAGAEATGDRGLAAAGMLSYSDSGLVLVGAVHYNKFNAQIGLPASTGFVPLFDAVDYRSFLVGAKYTFASTGTTIGANFHSGAFEERGSLDPEVQTIAFGIKQQFGNFNLSAQAAQLAFTNFTKGKDTAFMLGAEYAFSKRTAIYARAGSVKDDRGNVVNASLTPLPLAGGPAALLVPLGTQEVPLFAGAGLNLDARTSIVGVGIRHSF